MGSDWLLRFRSERDLDRLETVSYRVVSAVDNDFVKTTVSRDIFNPANVSQGRQSVISSLIDPNVVQNTTWRSDCRRQPSSLILRSTNTR